MSIVAHLEPVGVGSPTDTNNVLQYSWLNEHTISGTHGIKRKTGKPSTNLRQSTRIKTQFNARVQRTQTGKRNP